MYTHCYIFYAFYTIHIVTFYIIWFSFVNDDEFNYSQSQSPYEGTRKFYKGKTRAQDILLCAHAFDAFC